MLLFSVVTKTSGFTLAKAISCAVEYDDQHCGIYAGRLVFLLRFTCIIFNLHYFTKPNLRYGDITLYTYFEASFVIYGYYTVIDSF